MAPPLTKQLPEPGGTVTIWETECMICGATKEFAGLDEAKLEPQVQDWEERHRETCKLQRKEAGADAG